MGLFRKTWNLTSFIMIAKTSHTTSCEAILSSPYIQWRRWIPIGSKCWLQMQCDTLRIKGWEKFNLMCNAVEKTFEGKVNEWLGGPTTKRWHLALHTTSGAFNANWKSHLHLFRPIAQKGDTCYNPRGINFPANFKCLEREWPQAGHTYHLQQECMKIQQKPKSYDRGY